MDFALTSIAEGMFALLVVAAYTFVCFSFGHLVWYVLLRPLSWYRIDGATTFLLGQALLALAWLLIGLLAIFTGTLVLVFSGAITIYGLTILYKCGSVDFRRHAKAAVNDFGPFSWVLVVFFCIFGLFNLLLPMRLNSGDAFFYYMITPKVMALTGELLPVIGREWSVQRGLMGEMSYVVPFLFAGERAATLFAWVTASSVLVYFRKLGRKLDLSLMAKDLMWVMLLSTSGFYLFLSDGKVEAFGLSYAIAAFWWALQPDSKGSAIPVAVLTASFASFALQGKPSFLITAGCIHILLFIKLLRLEQSQGKIRQFLVSASLVGIVSVVCMLPYMIKNDIWYSTPLSPYPVISRLPSFLPESLRSEQLIIRQRQWQEWQGEDDDNPEPVRLDLSNRRKWFDDEISNSEVVLNWWHFIHYSLQRFQIGRLSPLVIGSIPMLFFVSLQRWRAKKDVLLLASMGVLGIAIYVYQFPYTVAIRTLLPNYLLLIPISAYILDNFLKALPRKYYLGIGYSISLVAIIGYGTFHQEIARVANFYGQQDPCQFDERAVSECEAFTFINETLPEGTRLLHGGYDYWLRDDLLLCLASNREWSSYNDSWEQMYIHGFTYFIEKTVAIRFETYPQPDWITPTVIFENDVYRVIKLESTKTIETRSYCQQTQRAWQIGATAGFVD